MVTVKGAQQTADSVRFVEQTASGWTVSSAKPFSALEKSLLQARTTADLDRIETAAHNAAEASGQAQARLAAANPAACQLYRFSTPFSCWVPSATYYDVGPSASAADIGAPIANCIQASVGTRYVGTTPAAGGSTCYQFEINASATVASQVILPADMTGIVELFAVLPNTLGLKVVDAQSPVTPLNVNVTSAYHRYAIVVRPGNGTGGQAFSIGIGTTATPIAAIPNSDAQHPKVLAMNHTQTDAITATGQTDFYYFYPSTANQTSAEFTSNFSTDQTVAYRIAQRSSEGIYSFNSETIATAPNQSLNIANILPNTTGATVVNGVMVRVSPKVPTAPVAGSFSVRTGVKTGYINPADIWNHEELTRLYPDASGRLQAYSYLGVNVSVTDANGKPVVGEAVDIKVYLDENNASVFIPMSSVTNAAGLAGFNPSIAGCPANPVTNTNTVTSSPGDRYTMVGKKGKVTITLPNAEPVAPNTSSKNASRNFYKVCSETYNGIY